MNNQTETIIYKDWLKKGENLFGKDKSKWKFVCCNCGNIQSIEDFKKAGIKNPDTKVHFSCIGRWINGKGELGNKIQPCNYTIGGLFNISKLTILKDGEKISTFKFHEPKEVSNETTKPTG